jgi:hypothetical protein
MLLTSTFLGCCDDKLSSLAFLLITKAWEQNRVLRSSYVFFPHFFLALSELFDLPHLSISYKGGNSTVFYAIASLSIVSRHGCLVGRSISCTLIN